MSKSASGGVTELLDYYPFGDVRLDEQSGSFTETNKFTGHELDDESGLYYMQARYHKPEVEVHFPLYCAQHARERKVTVAASKLTVVNSSLAARHDSDGKTA